MLNALQLPVEPDELLAAHARTLDEAWRHITAQVGTDSRSPSTTRAGCMPQASKPFLTRRSLTALRQRCEAMLPRVDIGELVLEAGRVRHPRFVEAFTALSSGETRLDDFHPSVAAALTLPLPPTLTTPRSCRPG